MDGTDKRKPIVIGKAAKPRAFRYFRPESYVTYLSNKKAWMTSILFQEFLADFNQEMKKAGRNVLLLLDNAKSHIEPTDGNGESKLTNIKIHFLPPKTTSQATIRSRPVVAASSPVLGRLIRGFVA